MDLPFGQALCVVNLLACYPTQSLGDTISRRERALGDFSDGRFAWQMVDVRQFKEPFPIRGRQGLFGVPDELVVRKVYWPPQSVDNSTIKHGQWEPLAIRLELA